MEFVHYKATPGERHLGIATIEVGSLILRYKIMKGDKGLFAVPPALKLGEDHTGRPVFEGAFSFKDVQEGVAIRRFVLENARLYMEETPTISPSATHDDLPF